MTRPPTADETTVPRDDLRLYCKCKREARIVRIGGVLLLGHVANPKSDHHPVRLASRSSGAAHPGASPRTSGAPLEEDRRGGGFAPGSDRNSRVPTANLRATRPALRGAVDRVADR